MSAAGSLPQPALPIGAPHPNHKWSGNLVFEVTSDRTLLNQYFAIYEERFRTIHKAHAYRHDPHDEDDRRSSILVARLGDLCVGGARLTIKTPEVRHPLPMEIDDFRVEERLPQLVNPATRYGQIGRICLAQEFAGDDATRVLLAHLYRKVIELDLAVIFGTAPMLNARAYRKHCVAMGLTGVTIHYDLPLPSYPMCDRLRFYLVSGAVSRVRAEVAAGADG